MTLCTLPEYSLRSKEYVVTNVRCTELRHCVSSINVEILRRKSASYDLSMRKSPTVYFISQRFTYYDLGHNLILFCHKDSKNIDCGKIRAHSLKSGFDIFYHGGVSFCCSGWGMCHFVLCLKFYVSLLILSFLASP